MKLDSVYVVVRDIGAARSFYAKLFEREPILVNDRFSGFDFDGVLFGLLSANHFGETVDTDELVYGNNCVPNVRVPDLETVYGRVAGLAPGRVTEIQDTGEYRLFQLLDVDGNRVEFYEARQGS